VRDDGPVREALRLDRNRLAFDVAVPGAVGFAIPLAAGLATGRVEDGVTASIGALIVGFANLGGGYRVRSVTLLCATLTTAVAALAGGLTGDSDVAAVVLMGVWGFASGLLVALTPRTAFVGLLSTWALVLASDLHIHGVAPVHAAALMSAGGLLQTLVAAYRALAVAARAPTSEHLAAAATALATAGDLIGDSRSRERERVLAEQGEWIRIELAALAATPGPAVNALLAAAAEALDAVATGDGADLPALRAKAGDVTDPAAREPALMLAARIAMDVRPAGATLPGAPPGGALRRALTTLRAQLTPRSSAFRHATRLGIALTLAVIAYRVLPIGRGYWVPVTVLFVLKPDYLSTFSRGIGRALGTMLGVAIAATLVTVGHPSDPVALAILAVLAFLNYTVFWANYALFSVALTVLVALLVEFAGGSAIGAVEERIVDTAIGAALALGAFALWPTREEPALRESLTRLLEAHVRWLDVTVAALADPDAHDPAAMQRERLAVRVARANAEAALQRAAAEPARRRPDVARGRAVLEALARIDDSGLVLAETAQDRRIDHAEPAIAAWGAALHATFERLAADPHDADPPSAATLALVDAARAAPDDAALTVVAARATAILAALRGLGSKPVQL
jgi:uncharacterized membrane protein YccC